MRRIAFVSLLSTVSTIALGGPGVPPIIGGSAATEGEYPNVVGILIGTGQNQGLCTGTLITPEWVMTAAHCVYPAESGVSTQAEVTSSIQVFLGTLKVFMGTSIGLSAQASMYDPMFAGTDSEEIAMGHDMGLIHLSQPVTGVMSAAVNLSPAAAPAGIAVDQVGFGQTSGTGGGMVGVLYHVAQTSEPCADLGLSDSMFLCYDQTDGKGKCNGDSGGPSFAQIGGKTVEIGTTSFGDQTCSQDGTDTRTDFEKAFLLANIPELQCTVDSDCSAMQECFEHQCIATPFTATGLGETCTAASDCDSGDCVNTSAGEKCSMSCTAGDSTTCPAGFDCLSTGASGSTAGVCWPSDNGGCCDASGKSAPTAVMGIAFVGVVLRRRRRSA